MALYHFSMKTVSRSAGRSSTAAAAYRSAEKIVDLRTGEIHDFTRKGGVVAADIVLPTGCEKECSRAELWNEVEQHHKRGDAVVAREVVVALPSELDQDQRSQLAHDLAQQIADRYGVAADVAIHEPSKEGDDRNHHAHILLSGCTIDQVGKLGKKAAELDPIHCKKHGIPTPADEWRGKWADMVNGRLKESGIEACIDHRSLEAQGIARVPTSHKGPAVIGIERRGLQSEVGRRIDDQVAMRLLRAKELGNLARLQQETARSIIDLSGDLAAAKAERDHQQAIGGDKRALGASSSAARENHVETSKNASEGLLDHRSAIIVEVGKMTGGRAQCFERERVRVSGIVFAVNEKYAAMHSGGTEVEIFDRSKLPISLGRWVVEKGRATPSAMTLANLSPLKYAFGSGVTEQLDRDQGKEIYLGASRGKSHGLQR